MTRTFLTLLVSILLLTPLNANDKDHDGVPDINDQCPRTPILEFSDTSGCSPSQLHPPLHTSLYYGFSTENGTIDSDESYSYKNNLFQLSLYSSKWGVQLYSSYYQYDQNSITLASGFNDTTLSGYYMIETSESLYTLVGSSLILPTLDVEGNSSDQAVYTSINYYIKQWKLFGGLSYTFINDKSTDQLLSNTLSGYIGVGRGLGRNFYLNTKILYDKDIYLSEHYNVGVMMSYRLNQKLFLQYEVVTDTTTTSHLFGVQYQLSK